MNYSDTPSAPKISDPLPRERRHNQAGLSGTKGLFCATAGSGVGRLARSVAFPLNRSKSLRCQTWRAAWDRKAADLYFGAATMNDMTETIEHDRLFLSLTAEPENIGAVREAVDRTARGFGMREKPRNDLKTLVSEACANVVLHAYADDDVEKPLEVEMTRQEEAVELVVRDQGQGVNARSESKPASLRLGLLLVGAMASSFQLRSARGGGTELRATVAFETA